MFLSFADIDILIWEASLAVMLVLTVFNFALLVSIWRRLGDPDKEAEGG